MQQKLRKKAKNDRIHVNIHHTNSIVPCILSNDRLRHIFVFIIWDTVRISSVSDPGDSNRRVKHES